MTFSPWSEEISPDFCSGRSVESIEGTDLYSEKGNRNFAILLFLSSVVVALSSSLTEFPRYTSIVPFVPRCFLSITTTTWKAVAPRTVSPIRTHTRIIMIAPALYGAFVSSSQETEVT